MLLFADSLSFVFTNHPKPTRARSSKTSAVGARAISCAKRMAPTASETNIAGTGQYDGCRLNQGWSTRRKIALQDVGAGTVIPISLADS
jgi:hypothetical protein